MTFWKIRYLLNHETHMKLEYFLNSSSTETLDSDPRDVRTKKPTATDKIERYTIDIIFFDSIVSYIYIFAHYRSVYLGRPLQ